MDEFKCRCCGSTFDRQEQQKSGLCPCCDNLDHFQQALLEHLCDISRALQDIGVSAGTIEARG